MTKIKSYNLYIDDDPITLTKDDALSLDFLKRENNNFHLLENQKGYDIEILEADYQNKKITLSVNGNKYTVNIEDEYDQLIKKMGLSSSSTLQIKEIKVPMPGLILDILVEVGQSISKGTELAILEAMKMENVLKAEGEGIIKSIEVNKGAAVEKGQVIIKLED